MSRPYPAFGVLAELFDITKNSKVIFDELAIMNISYIKEMNQHPVIFVSFKDYKGTYEDIVKYTKLSILNEFKRYKHVLGSMNEFDIPRYEKMIVCLLNDDTPSLHNAKNVIAFLANQLEVYYNKKVMVFVDEYDTPFVEAHIQGCYEELHHDLASLLRAALKGCDSLNMAMLTGIQRVAKENVFFDLNNLVVCTVKDNEYAQYFGFRP